MMKSRDGVIIPDASNSSSQFCPVNPIGQIHSYRIGIFMSTHFPPCLQGLHSHSSSLTQVVPKLFRPAGHL